MKKPFILYILVFFVSNSATYGQKTRFGNHFGFMTTNMNSDIDDVSGVTGKIKSGDMTYGYLTGFFFRQKVEMLTIGAELNLHYFTGSYFADLPKLNANGMPEYVPSTVNPSDSVLVILENLETRYRFLNIHMPILLGLKLGPLRAGVGPTLNKTLDVKRNIEDYENYEKNATNEFKSFYLGYQAGVGLDISRLSLDLKYDASTNMLGDADANVSDVLKQGSRTRSSFMLTIGYNILRNKLNPLK